MGWARTAYLWRVHPRVRKHAQRGAHEGSVHHLAVALRRYGVQQQLWRCDTITHGSTTRHSSEKWGDQHGTQPSFAAEHDAARRV